MTVKNMFPHFWNFSGNPQAWTNAIVRPVQWGERGPQIIPPGDKETIPDCWVVYATPVSRGWPEEPIAAFGGEREALLWLVEQYGPLGQA